MHRRECAKCHILQFPESTFKTRCGIVLVRSKPYKQHLQECFKCINIKQANYKIIYQNVSDRNRTESQKRSASVAGIKTNSDLKIRQQNINRIKKYGAENRDKILTALESGRSKNTGRSKAEDWLRNNILLLPQGRIRCQAHLKQVDFVDTINNIWIEIDGFHHFFTKSASKSKWPSRCKERLYGVQSRDVMLGQEALRRSNVMLLRFSGDCFASNTGKIKEWARQILHQKMNIPEPGIWCVGKLYQHAPWVHDGCLTLRWLTPHTIFNSQTE